MNISVVNNRILLTPIQEKKKVFIFYTGISFWQRFLHSETGNLFDIDMEGSYENHMKMLHKPLSKMGYDVNCAIVTNKLGNPKYKKYLSMYKAVDLDYKTDPTQAEIDNLARYFDLKFGSGGAFGFGFPIQGFRLLTIKDPVPEADLYIFCRCDLLLKNSIDKLNIDWDKINYLWKEEGIYRKQELGIETPDHPKSGWSICNRVAGNMLNVVPSRHIKKFINNYWLEHCSMHAMLKDHDDIDKTDFHIVLGDEMYDSCTERQANPIFTHNRTEVV